MISAALHFLVLVDGSEHSHRALQRVLEYSKAHEDARSIAILHVVEVAPPSFLDPLGDRLDRLMTLSARESADKVIAWTEAKLKEYSFVEYDVIVEEGEVCTVVGEVVKRTHPDVLVVGSRGMGAIERALLGSVSSHCLALPCSTWVVR
eukprot:TRINITY_DN16648_c0_g1_i1.p1 TRINITY_DN16648_c0_g1~~TRINITY_DN16648_c0_g1_i1.p1  ORF type:complete len:149 (+),score=26.25 TRINITY_DN16648_c0_g1_i1:205-651(+)